MVSLRHIVVDCEHAPSLARFWAAALDGYAVRPYDDAEIARLASVGLTPETDPTVTVDGSGPTLLFQQVPEPKTVKTASVSSSSRPTGQPRSIGCSR